MRSRIGSRTMIVGSALMAGAMFALSPAARADDAVAQAKLDVERYAGPQTKWEGADLGAKAGRGQIDRLSVRRRAE